MSIPLGKFGRLALDLVILIIVGVIYTIAAPKYGGLSFGDQLAGSLGYAMGAGILFLPVAFLLKKFTGNLFHRLGISGFRTYIVSLCIAMLVFVPLRIYQVNEDNQLVMAQETLGMPFGALYGVCAGREYLTEKCKDNLDSQEFEALPSCGALLLSQVPIAVSRNFQLEISSDKSKALLKTEVFERVDRALAQPGDMMQTCRKLRVDMDVLYKVNNDQFQTALQKYLAAIANR